MAIYSENRHFAQYYDSKSLTLLMNNLLDHM